MCWLHVKVDNLSRILAEPWSMRLCVIYKLMCLCSFQEVSLWGIVSRLLASRGCCLVLSWISSELSCIATYRSFPLVSNFCLKMTHLVWERVLPAVKIPFLLSYLQLQHISKMLCFYFIHWYLYLHGNSCVKEYTWASRKICISSCALLSIPPPSKCVSLHVGQAASFFRQEVKSDASHAGCRTTGWVL